MFFSKKSVTLFKIDQLQKLELYLHNICTAFAQPRRRDFNRLLAERRSVETVAVSIFSTIP
jgi:hypothetical protein